MENDRNSFDHLMRGQRQLDDYFGTTYSHGRQGEGCCSATAAAGATQWMNVFVHASANGGYPPTLGCGPSFEKPALSAVQKRSYVRAGARALQHGATWYKGKMVTVDSFPRHMIERLSRKSTTSSSHVKAAGRVHVPHRRFSLMQWNPGGLSQGSFLELRVWLRANPVDIVVLSETRWSFSATWHDQQWSYVHTAERDTGSGGILVMIHRRIIHPDQIGFLEQIEGRLMHVRLHFANRNLDLLAAYQYVWKDAWLSFLPKPGKPCTSPDQLRPISLMEPLGKLVVGLLAELLKNHLSEQLCQFPQFGFLPFRAATDAITRVASHCRAVRVMVAAQRRTVMQQMLRPPQYITCGGIQLFLDLNRAFDSVHRLLLFTHLRDIGTPENLHQLITQWHSGTHYNLTFQGQTTSIPVNVGLRQGCKIAPLLWVVFMDKFLQLLVPLTGVSWITQALTLYADDIHAGCIFHSSAELATALTNFGHVLDVLESMRLHLSYSKSFLIFAVAGSNYRHAIKGHLSKGPEGHQMLIPRSTGQKTALPLKATGKYLGVVLSYRSFEEQTWQLRKKAGWSAFVRLKPWFQNRHLQRHSKIHLWQSCVFSIMVYGLFSTNLTVKILQEFQSTYYNMMRRVIGDHSYCTHHTHQQAFQQFALEAPLQHLMRVGMGLWRRLCQRASQLPSSDFLRQVNWSHILDAMQLIHTVQTASVEVPIQMDVTVDTTQQASFQCEFCSFATNTLANLRRHTTNTHKIQQFRTCSTSPLSMSLHGRPQCNQCHALFSTWRSFFCHVERACCQGPDPRVPPQPGVELTSEPSLTAVSTFKVVTQPFWRRLLQIVQARRWHDLDSIPDSGTFLAHNCMICGIWLNRCQELHAHYRLYHGAWEAGIHAKGAQITKILNSSSPCNLCGKPFKRGHACPVATQLAALQLHAFPEVSAQADGLKCDVCNTCFEDKGKLHVHLHTDHGLQVHLWNPARDALPHSDACAHCGALFSTRDGVRRHILDGRCASFNPDAPSIIPTALPRWESTLWAGELSKQSIRAIDRQHLTLVCQLCSTPYSRTGDLLHHLQLAHSSLWAASLPMVRYLLQTVVSAEGCLCNPMPTETGGTHICALIRQLSMLFASSTQELFIPRSFVTCQVLDHFPHVGAHDAMKVIAFLLESRNFTELWHTPEILQFLRTHCIQCGGTFHPAALVQHCHCWHADQVQWAAQLAFQLAPILIQLQPQDHQCAFCDLVFNLPRTFVTDVDEAARQQLMQLHFDSNCPVLLQLLFLLQPLHGRGDLQSGRPRSGTLGEPLRAGSTDETSLPVQKRRRGGAPQQAAKARARRGHGTSPHESSGPAGAFEPGDASVAHSDAGGAAAREVPTTPPPTGILRYVHPGRSGGGSASVGATGWGMERVAAQAPDQPSTIDLTNSSPPRPADGIAQSSETNGRLEGGGCTVGPSPLQGAAAGGRLLAVHEVESRDVETGAGTQAASADAESSEGVTIPGGIVGGLLSRHPLSFTAAPGEDDTMAAPDQHSSRRIVENLGDDGAMLHLEPLGDFPQSAQSAAESTSTNACPAAGQGPPDEGEGTGQRAEERSPPDASMMALRHQLRCAAALLTFDNSGFLCYANSAVITFIWAFLSRSNFQPSQWGAQSALFQSLLLDHLDEPLLLDQQDWFLSLIQSWPERGGQADSAEFTGRLLAWVASGSYSQQWHRRVMLGQSVSIHDYSDPFMPLVLQVDPSLCHDYSVRLDVLVRHWHNELGMQAALTTCPDLICVHLDRFLQTPLGTIRKLCTPITFCGPVDIPIFVADDSTACRWESYGMISAFAHSGAEDSGHYQALLQTHPVPWWEGNPSMWLHCDDHRPPARCCEIPKGFQEGVTCIWLCRVDLMEMHQVNAERDGQQSGPVPFWQTSVQYRQMLTLVSIAVAIDVDTYGTLADRYNVNDIRQPLHSRVSATFSVMLSAEFHAFNLTYEYQREILTYSCNFGFIAIKNSGSRVEMSGAPWISEKFRDLGIFQRALEIGASEPPLLFRLREDAGLQPELGVMGFAKIGRKEHGIVTFFDM
eukprot:s2221_g2.t1